MNIMLSNSFAFIIPIFTPNTITFATKVYYSRSPSLPPSLSPSLSPPPPPPRSLNTRGGWSGHMGSGIPGNPCYKAGTSVMRRGFRRGFRHLRSLVWVWVWVWDWIHWHTSPRTRSPSSCHPPFTHYPFSPRSLVCGGQTSPHKPRLVISHSKCSPLSSSPHAHSFVLGTAVINNNNSLGFLSFQPGGKRKDNPELFFP
jgi:hypothetical protein